MSDIRYRHEIKHEISYADMLCIRQRLKAVASPDPHAKDGRYRIRSLYFDTPSDRALREKIDGTARREKFRIRYYNNDRSYICLEKKSRVNGLGTKYSARLTEEQTEAIIRGDISWMRDHDDQLVCELYLKMTYQRLTPKTVVDYLREPYIYGPGNVRVTFDSDIRTGLDRISMFDDDFTTIKTPGSSIILEVKWDDFLPGIIRDCVQTPGVRAMAFSKYADSRRYD